MQVRKSTYNLIIFWIFAIFFLAGFYYFLRIGGDLGGIFEKISSTQEKISEVSTEKDIFEALSVKDDKERTFLLLFQNNMELRPAGGYIGSFGILKVKNGEITSVEAHDTNIFDGRIKTILEPPYPMAKMLNIKTWGMRDSNFFPDFSESAQKAEYFYKDGDGQENFDGIVGINLNVLKSVLQVTGPISIEGYPQEFNAENVSDQLELAVEKNYKTAGLAKSDRKNILKDLSGSIAERVKTLDTNAKLDLLRTLKKNLDKKDIQLYFKDSDLQSSAEKLDWAGRINTNWTGDYLMINDCNLGALKTDRKINRSVDYTLDLSKEKLEAVLKISYENTGQGKNWMTSDYYDYLRVYAPKGSWLSESKSVSETTYKEEYNKKVFAFILNAPLAKTTVVELRYTLPENIKNNPYELLIQKQSGSGIVPVKIHITDANGNVREFSVELEKDYRLSSDDFLKAPVAEKKTEVITQIEPEQPAQSFYQKANEFAGIKTADAFAENNQTAKIYTTPKLILPGENDVIVSSTPKIKTSVLPKKISCQEKNDHPQKSKTRGKHRDEDCCPDPDEWPNTACVYSQKGLDLMLKKPK